MLIAIVLKDSKLHDEIHDCVEVLERTALCERMRCGGSRFKILNKLQVPLFMMSPASLEDPHPTNSHTDIHTHAHTHTHSVSEPKKKTHSYTSTDARIHAHSLTIIFLFPHFFHDFLCILLGEMLKDLPGSVRVTLLYKHTHPIH